MSTLGFGNSFLYPPLAAANRVPYWRKTTVGYAAFSTAGFTNDIELFSLPKNGIILAAQINPTVAFTGGLVASSTLSVGVAGNFIKYYPASSVFTTGLETPVANIGMESFSSATSIRVKLTTTVGLINTLTAGTADIYVLWGILP